MPVAEADVRTSRASRFVVQLCRHAEAMSGRAKHLHGGDAEADHPEVVRVECDETEGRIEFNWGLCVLRSSSDALSIRVEVDGEERLRWIQDLLATDLERFGRRDGLEVTWRGNEPSRETVVGRGNRGTTVALVAAAAVAVVAHVVAGRAALASWQWTSVAADLVLGAVVLKILVVVVLSRRGIRKRRGLAAHALGHLRSLGPKAGPPE
ncbi:DUF2218 domain-containing protein [Amycolatopsis sp. NPDC003865]